DQNNVWIINNRGFYKYKNRTLIPDTLLGYYSIQDAFFVDSTTGFAVGYGKYWKYKNGRWKQIYFDSKLGYPNLTSLYFVDSTLGWAVGNGGVILKYRNGIWSRETSPTTNNLTSVWFTSSTSGWAVGESGTVLKYTSGKWVLQPKLTNNHLYSVCFSDPENGWAVGERQTILQYKNQKWQIFSSTTYGDYYRKVTRTHGKWYITGSNGIILQWNDSIWDNLPINSKQEFLAIAFIDSLNGIAVSYNGLFETFTGGVPPYQQKTSLELLGNYYHSLVLSNDTIKILSNVRIDGSLKLKKSVKVVEFQGPYILQISGPLNAEGTLMQPIKFTVADSIISGSNKKWYNISMSANDANTWSTLKYCEFMHSDYGISVYHGKLNISNSKFTDCSTALYALNITEGQILNNEFNKITYNVLTINQSNKLVIENNLFTDNNANNCIQVNASSNIIFNKNIFTRNSGFRLLWFENSDVTLQLSKICNNEAGIMVNNGKLLINNCLIANNKYQQFYESPYNVGVIIANNCQLDILNSTIVNNKYPYSGYPGAALVYRFSGGNVYNSILWNNYIFDNDSSSLQPYQVYIYNNTSRPNFYSSNIQGGLNYFKKNTGVNFYGKYENNHSNNPLFINPTTGIGNDTGIIYDAMQANWQLQDNSTNINRGTLELGLLKLPDIDLKNQKRVQNGVVDIGAYENKVKPIEITSCDTIKNHTLWATDTVRIKNCNVVIASTGILSIKPGTRVEFWGPYKIIVQGVIRAIGTDKEPVIFTVHDTTGFVNTNVGGWKGIEFDNSTGVLDDKDSSIFKYCKFQYAKDTVGLYYIGMGIYGVIKAKYFSKLSITNSVFENNLAPFDSLNYTSAAVINIRNAKTIRIEKNMFVNNTGCLLKTEYAGLIFADNVIYKNKSMRRQNLLSIYSSEGNFYKNFFANNRSEIVNYNSLINFSGSNANFSNNVIVNNLDTGSGTVYSRYLMIIYGGRVQFHANTMANNSGVSYFYGLALKARNNIIWDDWVYAYGLEAGSYIQNNILKNASQYSYYDYYTSNIDKDPLFISPSSISGIASDGLSANWQLSYYSPAINSGTSDTTGMQIPRLDMAGNKRINGDAMDMGAYEHTGSKVQFVINPLGGNYCSGDSIVLVCKVNNEAKLQWQKDGVDIPSANDSILVLANLNELNSGNYVCKATNAYGTTFSPPAFIQVAVAPEVLTQPSTQWLSENQNEMITVTSTGTKPMKYYWYFRNNLIDSTLNGKLNIINASVNHEGTYYCRITNYCGSVETQPFGVYIKPQICLVTADTETGKNVVVWERKNGRKIKGYNIYRESMVRDIYEKLGFVNYLSPGVFVDSTSKPESRQYLYKIAVVSENDEVSPLSPYHKTLFLQYVSSVEGVNLMWQPYIIENGDVEFKSYVLFKGTDSTRLTPFDTVSSNITAYTDKDPLALNRLTFYRVAGLLYNACHSETLLKAGGGPFVEVLSNIEDNRLRSTGGGGGGTTIANINTSSFLSIYPQPASDVIKLSLTLEKSSSVQWEITNLTGTKVAFRSAGVLLQGNRELVINVSNIPSGTYLIKLQTNTNTWVDRIIIAR
ncbi:MAG: immunoglobulin domain-containing protein, partial [Bacteroidales bacterium]|nr:immunoglobulin domain-containing protein [Bacteroidales bacterium]